MAKKQRSRKSFNPRVRQASGNIEVQRARTPQSLDNELLGIVVQILGDDRMRVRCADGVERQGRIRGKIKKRMWTRLGDLVLISKWDFQDSHCDIVYRYRQPERAWLERKGYINDFLQP
ncbi:MAG: translation initiation factor eIF-1A [Candidatus Lokiarchaeota archaeon]|nr:translation initiation factor eIF-1A [Candidatus Lokiarchaeota archaeon]